MTPKGRESHYIWGSILEVTSSFFLVLLEHLKVAPESFIGIECDWLALWRTKETMDTRLEQATQEHTLL